MKECCNCGKELLNNRKKYCNNNCNYWYKAKTKDSCAGWGSKNSQMRLEKKTRSHAKRIQSGKAPSF